jgi:tetratricopeptide (TPR) repeat protein
MAALELKPFDFSSDFKYRLFEYSGEDTVNLRHLLEINFTRNNLRWRKGKLTSACKAEEIVWPKKMQCLEHRNFMKLTREEKKKAVQCSILGNIDTAKKHRLITGQDRQFIRRPLLTYLDRNLSTSTKKRQASNLTKNTELQSELMVIADLYLKAGDFQNANRTVIDAFHRLVDSNDYEIAFELLSRLEKLCRQENDIVNLCTILMKRGDTQKTIGDAIQAEKSYLEIIELYGNRQSDHLLAETYKDLGDVYKMKQDFKAGLGVLEKAIEIYEQLGDRLELSHTLNNMGNILSLNADHKKSFAMYWQALKIQKELYSIADVASTLNNMGRYYVSQGRLRRVLKLFTISLKLNRRLGNEIEIARLLNNLGFVNHDLGDFDKAQECLTESLKLNKKNGVKKELLFNFNNITEVMLSAGRLKESSGYLKEGMELANELDDLPHKAFLSTNMAAVFKRMGYYGQAMAGIEEALSFADKIADDIHPIINKIHLADIYYRQNMCKKARLVVEEILELTDDSDNRRLVMAVYTLRGVLESDPDLIHHAALIAEELKASRDLIIIKSKLISLYLKNEQAGFPEKWIDEATDWLNSKKSDIELSFGFNTIGHYHLKQNNISIASDYFQKAHDTALRFALQPEQADACRFIGQIFAKENNFEKAYLYYRKAMEIIKNMAGDIKNRNAKESFLSSDFVADLSREISEFRQIMT